ncbi:hypothetical protein Leryth_012017 [Lithospermum erythrorhizon]|nr:hypothetical protein Leryth_012017 [Lithospermum erythrorhizon]
MSDKSPNLNSVDLPAVDSTTTSAVAEDGDKIDEKNNLLNSTSQTSSSSAIANGLSSLLSSVIKDFDSRAESTINSQDQLGSSLDRLNGELDRLLEDAPLPFIMQHAARISGVRKRVSSLNSVLKSIQRRVDNIDRLLSAGVLQGAKDGSGQQ